MKILIADHAKSDVMTICGMLADYSLLTAADGVEAMAQIEKNPDIEMMLLALNMPRMNGFHVLEAIRNHPVYSKIAVLILTGTDEPDEEIRGLEAGALDYIRKPLNEQSLRKRIEVHVRLKTAQTLLEQYDFTLEKAVREAAAEAAVTGDLTIRAAVRLLEIRDIEPENHTKRTQRIIRVLCGHLRTREPYRDILTDAYVSELFRAAPLHDIGKIGIPEYILLKPGKLTEEEFDIMKRHTVLGAQSFRNEAGSRSLSFIRTAAEMMETHHEKFDGSGYPYGLRGRDIPLAGRLMAIADVYDALAGKRVYKPAFKHQVALAIIDRERGRHFDPDIVDAFLEGESEIKNINDAFAPPQE